MGRVCSPIYKAERRCNEDKRSVDNFALLIMAKTDFKKRCQKNPNFCRLLQTSRVGTRRVLTIRFGEKVHLTAWIFFAVFLAKKEPDRLL